MSTAGTIVTAGGTNANLSGYGTASFTIGQTVMAAVNPVAPLQLSGLPGTMPGSGGLIPANWSIYGRITCFTSAGIEGTPSLEFFNNLQTSTKWTINNSGNTVCANGWLPYIAASPTWLGSPTGTNSTATISISSGSTAGTCPGTNCVVTVNAASATGLNVGQSVSISLTGVADGAFSVASVSGTGTTSFTYSDPNATSAPTSGAITPYPASGFEVLQPTSGCTATSTLPGGVIVCSPTAKYNVSAIPTTGPGAASPPSPSVVVGTVTTGGTGSATISVSSGTAPAAAENANIVYGTDDTAAIQNAINASSANGDTVFFPCATYLIAGAPLSTGSIIYARLEGEGGASANDQGGGGVTPTGPAGCAELVSAASGAYILQLGPTSGSVVNAGATVNHLGFLDASGIGAMAGAVHLVNSNHAWLANVGVENFINGDAVTVDGGSGGTSASTQYDFIVGLVAINVKHAVRFDGGKASRDEILSGSATYSFVGGGACIRFQGNPTAGQPGGGANWISDFGCNYFPYAIRATDTGSSIVTGFHSELSQNANGNGNGAGASNFGPSIVFDGNLTSNGCTQNQIDNSFFGGTVGLYLGPNCTSNFARSNVISSGSIGTPWANVGGAANLNSLVIGVSGNTPTVATAANSLSTAASGVLTCADGSGNMTATACVLSLANTPLTTQGDLLTVNGAGALARLALGVSANLYPKSNGTALVYSSLAAAGVGSCSASNWVSTLTADAAPTCTQPTFGDLASGTNTTATMTVGSGATLNGASGGTVDFSLIQPDSFKVPVLGGASPTAEGAVAYDSTLNSPVFGEKEGGSTTNGTANAVRTFPACVGLGPDTSATDAGTAGTMETLLGTTCVFPAAYFTKGKIVRVTISTEGVTPGSGVTQLYKVRLEKTVPTTTDVYLYDGFASTLGNNITRQFGITLLLVCRGASACSSLDVINSGGLAASNVLNNLNSAMPVSFDATAQQTLQVTIQFSAATGGNTARVRALNVEELN